MKIRKSFLKILILVIVILFTALVNTSKAENTFWSNIFEYGDKFLEAGKGNVIINNNIIMNEASDETVQNIMDDLYSILFPLAVVVTVIVGGVLGIKFMLASADDKAKIKEAMVPYVVGCVVIYGAWGIWRLCIQIFSVLS